MASVYCGNVTWSATQKPWTAYHANGTNLGNYAGLRDGQLAVEAAYGGRRLTWTRNDMAQIENWDGSTTS